MTSISYPSWVEDKKDNQTVTPLSDPVQGMDDLSRDLAGGEIKFGGSVCLC